MNNSHSHIISRLMWRTSLDKKEKAAECQNRLSNWSREVMPEKANAVFDDFCSAGECWQIEMLELDLGDISYHSLETELTEKLTKHLREKLAELTARHRLDINTDDLHLTKTNAANIGFITGFLLHGTMPWNYRNSMGSFNELLAKQLRSHFAETIAALEAIGVTYENVRQRLAWQTDEVNITAIIKGLEPGNHTHITSFANILTRIQAKKAVVKAGTKEFRKNVWLWILNYLLVEKGSLFNQISFLKSNIRQMAARYNTDYRQLMKLIKIAVHEVVQRQADEAGLISALKILLKENDRSQNYSVPDKSFSDERWHRLQQYFTKPSLRVTNKKDFNDLIICIAKHRKDDLSEYIRSTGGDWEAAGKHLTGASLQALLTTLDTTQASVPAEELAFLASACRYCKADAKGELLWKTVCRLLSGQEQSPDHLSDIYIRTLAKQSGISEAEIIGNLLAASLPSSAKTGPALQVYRKLCQLYNEALKKPADGSLKKYLRNLVRVACQQLHQGAVYTKTNVYLQQICNLLQYQPAVAFEVLVSYVAKDRLALILPRLLTDTSTDALARQLPEKYSAVLLILQNLLTDISSAEPVSPALSMNRMIVRCGVQVSLLNPGLSDNRFQEAVLRGLSKKMPVEQYYLLIRAFKSQKLKTKATGSADAGIHRAGASFLKRYFPKNRYSATGFAVRHLENLVSSPVELCIFLQHPQNQLLFAKLKASDTPLAHDILHQLTGLSIREKEDLIKKLAIFFAGRSTGLSERRLLTRLENICWDCAFNYLVHKGNRRSFEKYFLQTSLIFYNRQEPGSAASLTGLLPAAKKSDSCRLVSGKRISCQKLLRLINRCLIQTAGTLTLNGEKYSLQELVNIAFDNNETDIKQAICSVSLTGKRIQVISRALSFCRLAEMVAVNGNRTNREVIGTLKTLYELIRLYSPSKKAAHLMNEYHKQILLMIRGGSFSMNSLQPLLYRSLTYLITSVKVNPALISSQIKAAGYRLPVAGKKGVVSSGRESEAKAVLTDQPEPVAEIITRLIRHHKISFRGGKNLFGAKAFFSRLVKQHPVVFLGVIKTNPVSEAELQWMMEAIGFTGLIKTIAFVSPAGKTALHRLLKLYRAVENIPMVCLTSKQLQWLMIRKGWEAWRENNWRLISRRHIWHELFWEATQEYGIGESDFTAAIQKAGQKLPRSWRMSPAILKGAEKENIRIVTDARKMNSNKPLQQTKAPFTAENLPVKNAGLVLISSYISLLFSRLEFDNRLKSKTEDDAGIRSDAVHALQYLATGLSHTDEHYLILNKVLCGVPLCQPVKTEAQFREEEKNLVDSLLLACIDHWPVIGECTPDGFRGNWLVRDGLLTEKADRWELSVEKRAYDILISRSPFSFSLIQFPWMEKPLHVHWPY